MPGFHNRRPRLTDDEKRDIVRRYLTGEPVNAIAKAFGVTATTISRTAKEVGAQYFGKRTWDRTKKLEEPDPRLVVPAPPPIAAGFYTPCLAEVARLKAKGLGNTKIAALLRMPYRVVESVSAATAA